MFELDLVSSACLGSYRSTLHRPSPLFRNIYSAAITARWTLEFQFIKFGKPLSMRVARLNFASVYLDLGIRITNFEGRYFSLSYDCHLDTTVTYGNYYCAKRKEDVSETVPQLIYGRYTIIVVCYVQCIDIFVLFCDNTSHCSLIHFHEFFCKDKIIFSFIVVQYYNDQQSLSFQRTVCRVSPSIVKVSLR